MHFALKVATFPGGLELMLCAGFIIEERECAGSDEAAKMYLSHSGAVDPLRRERLRYVFNRFASCCWLPILISITSSLACRVRLFQHRQIAADL